MKHELFNIIDVSSHCQAHLGRGVKVDKITVMNGVLSLHRRETLEEVSCSWVLLDLPSAEAAISFLDKAPTFQFFTLRKASENLCRWNLEPGEPTMSSWLRATPGMRLRQLQFPSWYHFFFINIYHQFEI